MIITLGYRGLFRQQQYETVTVEGSISFDLLKDDPDDELTDIREIRDYLQRRLDILVHPLIERAAQTSIYTQEETTVYEWEGLTDNGTGDQAQDRQPHRRVRRRS